MKNLIINDNENENSNGVVIESRGEPIAISMQVYQDIYNQITGKTEEIVKISKKSILANLDDVKQLDIKIKQILEQYKIVANNSSFTIFFNRDKKETHSSIEKFYSLNNTTNGCTDNILIKYNFSIVLPLTDNPQNYTITIRLTSRITNQRNLLEELPPGAPRILVNMFSSKTCEIKISYVDYVVSRTIMTAFDEWLDALDESKNSYFLRIGRKFSHFIPSTFKYISLIICSLFIINMMPILIGASPSISDLASFSLLSFLFIFFIYKIASFIGQFVENSIDSSSDISYLDVTKGDKKLIKEALSENNKSIAKTISGSILMIVLNFLAKYLAIHLKI